MPMSGSAWKRRPRKMSRRNRFSSFLLGAAIVLAGVGGALAQARSLDAPRAQGTVGERYDGYAVVRDAAANVGGLVDQVNAERRKLYGERAQKEKAPADQI